jgi:hypothetical protein
VFAFVAIKAVRMAEFVAPKADIIALFVREMSL